MNGEARAGQRDTLRGRAERAAKDKKPPPASSAGKQPDTDHILHELSVHQIELELQNEELRRAQEELQQARDKYADLYDFAPVGYATLDRKGTVVEANLFLCQQLQTKRGLLLNRRLGLFLSPKCLPAFNAFLDRIFGGCERQIGEVSFGPHNSPHFHAQLEGMRIGVAPDGTMCCRVAVENISERKDAEEALREHKETLEKLVEERSRELLQSHLELERSRRMADIGTLAATIAHELRNPLAAIRASAYNIARKAENPLLEGHLSTINKKVIESDQIIQNLLAFSRIKAAKREQVQLYDTVKECIAQVYEKYAGWKVELTECLECAKNETIEADSSQFRMLCRNLLDNAFQSLQDKTGRITVAVRPASRADRPGWKVSFRDNGAGIDKEDIARIFEPFYTTKAKGTGLGLTLCKEIVELHRGTIEIESRKGTGTTLTVTLPVS